MEKSKDIGVTKDKLKELKSKVTDGKLKKSIDQKLNSINKPISK
ncbi:hypothetical protein [Pedobacter sp. HDW13]|nr:hypothetical protein [Pedobacter sp. HDW13]